MARKLCHVLRSFPGSENSIADPLIHSLPSLLGYPVDEHCLVWFLGPISSRLGHPAVPDIRIYLTLAHFRAVPAGK